MATTWQAWAGASLLVFLASGCKDIAQFSTEPNESYCGGIVAAPIVRRGFGDDVRMRMTFHADNVESAPGLISTSDNLLQDAAMRPLPELSHDPLLTFTFGEGRDRNLLYVVDPTDPSQGASIMVVLSLMHTGNAEVRLLRGAPPNLPAPPDAGALLSPEGAPLFGLFAPLKKKETEHCSF